VTVPQSNGYWAGVAGDGGNQGIVGDVGEMGKKSKTEVAVTAETIVIGIASDAKFKDQCAQFFALAMSRACAPRRRSRPGAGLFIMNNVFYDADDELRNAAKALVRACVVKLGPKFGNANELNTLIWSCNKQGLMDRATPADIANGFIEALKGLTRTEYIYVCGNHLIAIDSGTTKRITVGPLVEIVDNSKSPIGDIFDNRVDPGVDINVGGDYVRLGVSGRTLSIPTICWKVSVNAALAHRKEEAEWLIDVAVSLIRLYHFDALQTSSMGFFPGLGKVEPMPCVRPDSESRHLYMTREDIFAGASSTPPRYHLDDAVISAMTSSNFIATAEVVFRPPPGSLAERFGQGLGWLTRGRQSEDRAQRILFVFTALEAILSSDDKTSPVIQNIARSAAVILSNDVAVRAEVAKNIKDLYAYRSGVVHSGKRGVTGVSVNTAQELIESVFVKVLQSGQLSQSFQKFLADVSRCTYGLPWPEHGGQADVNDESTSVPERLAPSTETSAKPVAAPSDQPAPQSTEG